MQNFYTGERCLIFDESGNLGSQGRYFVIACIETFEYKSLHNIMKNKLGKAKIQFPNIITHSHEIKAADAFPMVKYHILESIAQKNISVSYIVADLKYVQPRLLQDKNIFYNYLMRLLLDHLITPTDTKINILCDNKTTKVASMNSFSDYIYLHYIYEQQYYQLNLNVQYLDSDAKNSFSIQAADYVANALYLNYEYNKPIYKDIFNPIVKNALHFPYKNFGK